MTTTAAPGLHVHDRYGDAGLPPLTLSNETLSVQLAHRSVAGPGSLAGRDRIRDALVELGLPSR